MSSPSFVAQRAQRRAVPPGDVAAAARLLCRRRASCSIHACRRCSAISPACRRCCCRRARAKCCATMRCASPSARGRGRGRRTRSVARHAALLPAPAVSPRERARHRGDRALCHAPHRLVSCGASARPTRRHWRSSTPIDRRPRIFAHAKAERPGRTVPPHGSTARGHPCDDDLRLRPERPGAAAALPADHRASRGAAAGLADVSPQDRAGAAGARLSVLGRRPRLRHRLSRPPPRAAQARRLAAVPDHGGTHPRPAARPHAAAVGDVRDRRTGQRRLAAEGQLRARHQGPPRGGRRHRAGRAHLGAARRGGGQGQAHAGAREAEERRRAWKPSRRSSTR